MQGSINFMYIFPYGLYPVLTKDSALLPCSWQQGMQFLPELPELNCATPYQNSNHFQDLWFLLGQVHQSGKRKGMGGDLSGVTKYLEKKYFRASLHKFLSSLRSQYLVTPQVLMAPYRHCISVLF